jgi:predicted SnoaL-like aldol condensation-catalyzing enzyme
MAESQTQIRKQIAVQFLELVVAGQIDEAYHKYVDMQGVHHNPYFPAGFPALKQAMQDDQNQHPNKRLEVQNVLGDGELVAVHSRLIITHGQAEMSVVHLSRFTGDKIVEMWDVGQSIPDNSPNSGGSF